jgi:CDP-paratose 2-epimerase
MRPAAVKHTVVTGGAGFVGTNLAARLAKAGTQVVVFDDLSRAGVEANLRWLLATHPRLVTFQEGDVRDRAALRRVVRGADAVFHLAAQVAVTTSLTDPLDDFTVNAVGTVNLLEEVRRLERPPFVLFTSTNKVYGNLADLTLCDVDERWQPGDARLASTGLSEERELDFCTPYGCSKGAADQYVLDYARSYGIPATVFRMSCIYGPHQYGTEDQGWVAHFALRVLDDLPITVYGDGHQVRDILFAGDLVEAMLAARAHAGDVVGKAFNIGGGPPNAVSLHDVLGLMADIHGRLPDVSYDECRSGDQRYYVSDCSRFRALTGWRPKVRPRAGITTLFRWLADRSLRRPREAVAR